MDSRTARLLEEYVRLALLKEGDVSWKALAAATPIWTDEARMIIVYQPSALLSSVKKTFNEFRQAIFGSKVPSSAGLSSGFVNDEVIVGFIYITSPDTSEKCNGAWEVKLSAGPGYGRLIYGLALAASPNGILMPDRAQVSPAAQGRWAKLKKLKMLDDAENPATPERDDDCDLLHTPRSEGGPDPLLDATYVAEGWEKAELARARQQHSEVLEWLSGEVSEKNRDRFMETVRAGLEDAGKKFFSKKYHG